MSENFTINMPITNHWSEEVEVEKQGLTKGKGKNEEKFIQVTVSGVNEDRDGERISNAAALDMVEQYKSGSIPLYPNHGRDPKTGERAYNWQDMMGVWTDAFFEGGKIVATARLNKAHPDFQKFWNYMESGMPLGFSIGGKTTDEFMEDVDDETE